jgi:hypothetical protein
MRRFQQQGFEAIAYDSRAHGKSGGDACTYGYFEKEDLRRVIDTVRPGPVVLIGSSLGAAVALQLAATDRRITGVVAAESFSDLRTVVTERAPFIFTPSDVAEAIRIAEQKGGFPIDRVNPAAAARTVTAPVLLIHGATDKETPPAQARRIFSALAGPKCMILVPEAGHNQSLHGSIWEEIERWVDSIVPPTDIR